MRVLGALSLLACAAAADASLEARLDAADRAHAEALVAIAARADAAGQRATARLACERALELDPDDAAARARLGFLRGRDGWMRTKGAEAEVGTRKDARPATAERFRAEIEAAEKAHLEAVVAACGGAAADASARPRLERLLLRHPDSAALKRAAGYEEVKGRLVPPELLETARALDRRLRAWAACRAAEGRVAAGPPLEVGPAGERVPVWVVNGARQIATKLPEASAVALAKRTQAVHAFLLEVLGPESPAHDPSLFCLLPKEEAFAVAREYVQDDQFIRIARRHGFFRARNLLACVATDSGAAAAAYAFLTGALTAAESAAPPGHSIASRPDVLVLYPWFVEGLGRLASLEACDETRFEVERGQRLPRSPLDRAAHAAWVRAEIASGSAEPLRELLDRDYDAFETRAGLLAASFLRFLLLHDPAGGRRLAPALRAADSGPPARRAEAALKAAFGQDADELGRLWRRFALDVDAAP